MFHPNRAGLARVVTGMTPDELFQRLRFSSKVLTGVFMLAIGGVGFGLAALVWGVAGMPEFAMTLVLGFVVMGGVGLFSELGFLGFELYARRRARQLLLAGDHRRAERWVLRAFRNTAIDLGDSDPEALRWQITYAQVMARIGRTQFAENLVLDVVDRTNTPLVPVLSRIVADDMVRDFCSRPVEVWWPALDVREVGRRIAQSRAVLVLYAGIVVGAACVGLFVLAAGADGVPSWMLSGATAIGLGLVLVIIQVPLQVWAGVSLLRRVDQLLARGDHEGAANNVEVIVGRHLQRGGPEDPEALRWMTTLAHLQLLRGRDRDAVELLSVLRMEQRRLHGAWHPDVARTERVITAAMAGSAARTTVETWWR